MWHPSHRVSMGIETGFIIFYSYNFNDSLGKKGKLSFQSIPILVEYSFPLTKRLNIYAGSGIYLLYTVLDYGVHSKAQKFSPGKDDASKLHYGQSITDPCIGWEHSLQVLDVLSDAVKRRRR